MADNTLEFQKKNTPSSGRNTTVKIFSRSGMAELTLGEFESYTWRVAPIFLDYRPFNTKSSVKVYDGYTVSGSLSRGLVDYALLTEIGKLGAMGYCELPESYRIQIEYCIPSTGETKLVILSGITITNYELSGSGGNINTESMDFEATSYYTNGGMAFF